MGQRSNITLSEPLQLEKAPPSNGSPLPGDGAVELLGELAREWHLSETTLRERLKGLPAQLRDLHTLQVSVNKLQLYSEFISRAAEAASSVVRRIQQSGGG